jgi:RNA polymerase sigma-70 factor, ECF subfamily
VNEPPASTHDWRERLYEEQARKLILYGRALGLSHSEAEDLLQETFLALLLKGSCPERPERYCVRAFRNRALNYRRSLWRRLVREIESSRWFEPSEAEVEIEQEAMRCLAGLPVPQREVIILKIWHQYTFEEIGELLDVSHNTVAGRYRYGMQKLRIALRKEDYEPHGFFGRSVALLGAAQSLSKS